MDIPRPRPVIGLLLAGSLLILLEGCIFLSFSISGVVLLSPAIAIVLALILLLLTWAAAEGLSPGLGVVFVVLGALSFLVGAGFIIGGILVVTAGSLEIFADWIRDPASAGFLTSNQEPGPLDLPGAWSPAHSSRPEYEAPPNIPGAASHADSPRSEGGGVSRVGGVLVYSRCSHRGELVPRGITTCPTCRAPLAAEPAPPDAHAVV